MEIIGRGGFGTIYATRNPNLVKKANESPVDCKNLSHEFVMQVSAYEVIGENEVYSVPRPSEWRINDGKPGCSFIMDRIYPPDDGIYSWHLYWDHHRPDYDHIIGEEGGPIRGRYLGLSTLERLLPTFDFNRAAYYAGILLSTVQYGSLQTATDTELIIGYRRTDNKLKIFLIDYNLSKPWASSRPPYQDLIEHLDNEPYWPSPESPLYDSFTEGYIKGAKKHGMANVAIRVLEERA